MKHEFQTQIEAVEWIADVAKDEAHFEILREDLLFNHIYSGLYFVIMSSVNIEVALLDLHPN